MLRSYYGSQQPKELSSVHYVLDHIKFKKPFGICNSSQATTNRENGGVRQLVFSLLRSPPFHQN